MRGRIQERRPCTTVSISWTLLWTFLPWINTRYSSTIDVRANTSFVTARSTGIVYYGGTNRNTGSYGVLEVKGSLMALTSGNGVRFSLDTGHEFRVWESILFLRSINNTTRLKAIRRVAGVWGMPFKLVLTRCCEARKSLGSAGTLLDIYLIIASTYKSLISGGQ